VTAADVLRADLDAAMAGGGSGLAAANELCRACVELLDVDGAAISYVHNGSSRGTFGSSGVLSRRLDEYQFTFGEGPCLDAVAGHVTVLVPDLSADVSHRWPAFTQALLGEHVAAVFAAPVLIAASPVGALDLFRHERGPLSERTLEGFAHAADLAAFPLLDLIASDLHWESGGDGRQGEGWEQLSSLERVEVYQATGMIMDQLDIGVDEALVRLRAGAFARGRTASELAWAVITRATSFREPESKGAS
jgi:GAF domain-containing protein